jgi:hypothetical protein
MHKGETVTRRLAAAAAFILFAGAAVPAHTNTLNIAGTFNGNAAIAGFPGPLVVRRQII